MQLTGSYYQQKSFRVAEKVENVNVEEYFLIYENDSDQDMEVESTFTQDGMRFVLFFMFFYIYFCFFIYLHLLKILSFFVI